MMSLGCFVSDICMYFRRIFQYTAPAEDGEGGGVAITKILRQSLFGYENH